MTDLTITAANVAAASTAVTGTGTAGATITAGQPVYADATDSNHLKLADNDVEASAVVKGIALHASLDGQPLTYAVSGNINLGATLAVGETYVASSTAGGIAPIADLATGDYVTHLGVASAAGNLELSIDVTGSAKP